MTDVAHHIPYYRVNKYLLSAIGQWPYQRKLKKQLLTSFVYIPLLSLLVPELIGLVEAWGDVDTTIECIPPILANFLSITLITNCVCNLDKMELILSKIKKDWATWSVGPEIEILHTYARNGEAFNILFAFCIFSTMVVYIAMPITPQVLDFIIPLNETRPKKTLYPTEYFLDAEKYFYWMLVHAYVASFMCTITIVSVDTIFMAFLHHACGILAILGFRLKSILRKIDKSTIDKVKFKEEVDAEIKFCAKKHRSIIIFVHDMRDCFSTAFFLVLGNNMIIMSVTGVQTVMKLGNLGEAMRFGVFTLGQMFHLFYLSIPCQQLIDQSLNVSDSIYNGYWYQLPSGSQKLLLMIMRRCSKTCSFTAGKVYIFSMQNFSSILRTSMSYFTVLSSIR